jgi:hypothetical protein
LLDTPGAALLEKFHFDRTAIDCCKGLILGAPSLSMVPGLGNSRVENATNE